jgi:hypothetical protein
MTAERQDNELSEAELRASTAVTRALVADDVSALAAKLSIKNIEAEAKQAAIRSVDGAVANVRSRAQRLRLRLAAVVRQHRVALLITGSLAIGLLVWRRRSR